MTVQIRGFSFAMSSTIPLPAGTQPGDVLVLKVRAFHHTLVAGPVFTVPAGYTELVNARRATDGNTPSPPTFGYASFWKVAAVGEADPVALSPGGEAVMGGLWAVYSDSGQSLDLEHEFHDSALLTQTWALPIVLNTPATGRLLYSFSGQATVLSNYAGFANGRTHHATGTLHTAQGYPSVPNGPPEFPERLRDVMLSLDSEPGPAGAVDPPRSVDTNVSHDGVSSPVFVGTYARIMEIGPPPVVGGWLAWVVD